LKERTKKEELNIELPRRQILPESSSPYMVHNLLPLLNSYFLALPSSMFLPSQKNNQMVEE
jgi:hypothetical protein